MTVSAHHGAAMDRFVELPSLLNVTLAAIDRPRLRKREWSEAACRQEEGHVAFGEQELIKLLKQRPGLRKRLLGLHLLSLWVVNRFERWISKRADKDHAVLCQIPEYIGRIVEVTDLRLRRMGVTTKPLAEYGRLETFLAISRSLAQKLLRRFRFWRWFQRRRLTSTYLRDPYLQEIMTLAEIESAAGIPVVKAA
ncbi:MAG: hypothetical protein IID33_04690 [Planctomycetes bacterium]|nr:hypothetical protein [Planctomycetota bacterium]